MAAIQGPAAHILATGAQITTSGTSQRIALPVNAAGVIPRYVMLTADSYAYVRLGNSAVTATANDLMVNGQTNGFILACRGCTHVAALQKSGGAIVNISPMED